MVLLAGLAALLFAAPSIATGAAKSPFGGEKVACSKLKSKYPDSTFLPGSSGYAYETQERMSYQWRPSLMFANDSQLIGQPQSTAVLRAFSFLRIPSRYRMRSPR
jgi:hypothetical protein